MIETSIRANNPEIFYSVYKHDPNNSKMSFCDNEVLSLKRKKRITGRVFQKTTNTDIKSIRRMIKKFFYRKALWLKRVIYISNIHWRIFSAPRCLLNLYWPRKIAKLKLFFALINSKTSHEDHCIRRSRMIIFGQLTEGSYWKQHSVYAKSHVFI